MEVQQGASGGINTSGGGGQVPPQDVRPVQTGKIFKMYSRTFRHYITLTTVNYTETFNQGWSRIPYEHICSSLKPRDWQEINTVAKRWRVLSCGFKMSHIVPFINTKETVGGAIQPDITFNLLPYLETYIDKPYQLPPVQYNMNELPNRQMTRNNADQATGTLPKVAFTAALPFKPQADTTTTQTVEDWLNYSKLVPWAFDLMNSREWNTVNAGEEMSFEHTFSGEDLRWRHGLAFKQHFTQGIFQEANPYGRWDGGINNYQTQGIDDANNQFINRLKHHLNQPLPSALVRPLQIHASDNKLVPIAFCVLINYHCWIEMDCNDIGFYPIFPQIADTDPTNPEQIFHIYRKATDTENQPPYYQWSGASALTPAHTTGPTDKGALV